MSGHEALRLAAVDLGADSGRVLVGTFDGDRLSVEETCRFPNVPVTIAGTLHWDFLRLFGDVVAGLRKAGAAEPLSSVGIDTWGVDFGLLDARGRLLANPVHYRDTRTDGMQDAAFAIVPRAEIHETTGNGFWSFNTVYQLLSMVRANDPLLDHADRVVMIADLVAHFLSGATVAEYTIASTSQCLDAISRDWARPLLERLGIPTRLLPEIAQPGTSLGGLRREVAGTGLEATKVVLPASHDSASAVAGAPLASSSTAYISSGTWSIIGLEIQEPVISRATLTANLTNEGGVAGTVRLLCNVPGLWLVQESRRALWPAGDAPSFEELAAMAEAAPAFTAFIDPDDDRFMRPGDLPARVRTYCAVTGQPVPDDPGTLMRVLLESLVLRYAAVIDGLGAASGHQVKGLQVVGGGSNHRLLCRLTAAATGLPVRSGPVEATAIGNLVVQAITAGEVASVAQGRDLIARSFPMTTYEPTGDWAEARARFAVVAGLQSKAT